MIKHSHQTSTYGRTHPVRVAAPGKKLPMLVRHDPDIAAGRRRFIDMVCISALLAFGMLAIQCWTAQTFWAGCAFVFCIGIAIIAVIVGVSNHLSVDETDF